MIEQEEKKGRSYNSSNVRIFSAERGVCYEKNVFFGFMGIVDDIDAIKRSCTRKDDQVETRYGCTCKTCVQCGSE